MTRAPLPVECEARVVCPIDQPARAVHGHHRQRRQRDKANASVIGVCARCHLHLHDHPTESYGRGLLLHSWDDITPYVPWWYSS